MRSYSRFDGSPSSVDDSEVHSRFEGQPSCQVHNTSDTTSERYKQLK